MSNKIFIYFSLSLSLSSVCKKNQLINLMTYFFMATCMPFQDEWMRRADNSHFLLHFYGSIISLVFFHGLKINDQWEIQQVSCVYALGFLLPPSFFRLLVDHKFWSGKRKMSFNIIWKCKVRSKKFLWLNSCLSYKARGITRI